MITNKYQQNTETREGNVETSSQRQRLEKERRCCLEEQKKQIWDRIGSDHLCWKVLRH